MLNIKELNKNQLNLLSPKLANIPTKLVLKLSII